MSVFSEYVAARLAIAARLRLFQQLHQDAEPVWYRAAGGCLCGQCGLEYRLHPASEEHGGPSEDRRLCNGDIVHL